MTVDPDLLDVTRARRPGVTMKKVNVDPQEALMTLDILAIEAADITIVEAADALALWAQTHQILTRLQIHQPMKEEKESIKSIEKIESTKSQR